MERKEEGTTQPTTVDDLLFAKFKIAAIRKNIQKQNKALSNAIFSQIGSNILKARAASGLSQADVADCLGMDRTSIIHIEKGKQRIQIHVLYAIAKTLKTTVSDLLAGV